MIKNISYFYLHYILKNPINAIIFLVIILGGMMTFATNFKLDASADSLILENDKDLVKYRNVISRYDTKEFIVMTYTPSEGKIFDENKRLSFIIGQCFDTKQKEKTEQNGTKQVEPQ